jgi:transposase
MYDVNDDAKVDAKGGFRRIEILTGPARRRRWSAEEKTRIVAGTLVPGGRMSEVARRWQVCPQQVFAWRHAARRVATTMPRATASPVAVGFVPIVSETAPPEASSAPAIEVRLAGAVVRVACGMDGALLTAVLRPVLRAVRALSPVEFAALFDGLDWTRVQTTKEILKPSVAA